MSFCVAGAALCDIPTCLITCRRCRFVWQAQDFYVAFVASAAFWRSLSSFCMAGAALQTCRIASPTLHTQHFTFHTLHCILYALHFTLYTPHSTIHTLHSTHQSLHSTLYTPHFTILHSTLHTSPHSTLYTLHFTLYTLHSYTEHSTLHTLHSTLYTPYFTQGNGLRGNLQDYKF